MKVSNMKKFLIIGICLLVVILVLLFFLHSNADNRLVTENREELKSITIQICDKKGNAEKNIIITDTVYMYSIFNHLSSTKTVIKKENPQIEGKIKLLLTYSYAYDDHSGEEDVVFWDTENNFYRYGDKGYVFGKNIELNSLLYDLFKDVELEMVSENQSMPQSITICEYEGNHVKSGILLEDTESIDYIFSNLKAIETKAILYPSALSEFALDTEYELTLEYEDQENIIIFTGTETADTFYRYSKTISSSGEEGYVFGKNFALYEFIVTLFEDHQPTVSMEPLHYKLPTATLEDQIATSEEPMTVAEAAEILAPLTNEDGTGEINLNMTWQEIAAVLDEKGVPYRVSGDWKKNDEEGVRRIFVDYSIIYAPSYHNFSVAITKKGLKMNDPVSVALELYGEPDKTERDPQYDNLYYYYYNMGKLYCKATDSERTVLLHLSVGDETVVNIQIKFLDQTNYLGENLEETFWE